MTFKRKLNFSVVDKNTKAIKYMKQQEMFNYEFLKIAEIVHQLEKQFHGCQIHITVL